MTETSTNQQADRDEVAGPEETDGFVAVLDHLEQLPEAVRARERSYELLALGSGHRAVDVGCGTGRAVAELIDRGVDASGVDADERMITVARTRYPRCDFHVASADALPYPDGDLAGYRADKMYHEFADPTLALGDAQRVLAPGGRLVLLGQDWDTIAIDADDGPLTRLLVHALADTIPDPWSARRYRSLLMDAGFSDVAVEVWTGVLTDYALMAPLLAGMAEAAMAVGAVTREQAHGWLAEQESRGKRDRFCVVIPLFVASATNP